MTLATVLFVEDDPDDQELVRAVFAEKKIPADLRIVSDAEEALAYLRGPDASLRQTPPACILLDLRMPRVTGLEAVKEIRADPRAGRVPIILFTSSSDEADIREAYRLGVNSYVAKPVDFGKFSQTLTQVLDYWLTVNASPGRDA